MITVQNITRKYDNFIAVDNVSFTIGQGEIVGLLGHNGAGKTTIMKMLTGYLEPTAGKITIGERLLNGDRRPIQEQIGYLPENCPVYPEMSVIDYLDYGASLHGVEKAKRQQMVLRAIERTALAEKAHQQIATLSRGYRQRTGVAQAILHDPKILILDEPTNGLDPTQIQQMRQLIRELAKQSTVIISTHILQGCRQLNVSLQIPTASFLSREQTESRQPLPLPQKCTNWNMVFSPLAMNRGILKVFSLR